MSEAAATRVDPGLPTGNDSQIAIPPPRWLKAGLQWLLRSGLHLEIRGMEHAEQAGERVLIVANHTSLLDAILIYLFLPTPPTFIINRAIAQRPLFRPLVRYTDLLFTEPGDTRSLRTITRYMQGTGRRHLAVFPEGRVTVTGTLMKIYGGAAMIAEQSQAELLPIAIDGAQHSVMSYMRGKLRRSLFPKVRMTVLPPRRLDAGGKRGQQRRGARQLERLMYEVAYHAWYHRREVFPALLEAAQRHGMGEVICRDPENRLSYRDLLTRALALAAALQRAGVNEERVGVLLPTAAITPVVFMALQCMGRVPAMLNYTMGPQSCLGACDTAGLATVLSSRRFIERAGLQELAEALAGSRRLIYLEDLRATIGTSDRLLALLRRYAPLRYHRRLRGSGTPDADRPAAILFTSGSEGAPKGVVLSHANLLGHFAQARCYIDFTARDLVFCCLPTFHSFGMNVGMLMPLLAGTPVFFYPTPLHYRQIPELIYLHRPTILFGTNTFLRGYARHAHPFDLHTLRYVVAGAEKLTEQTSALWQERFGIRILQGYGVTETSAAISCNTPLAAKPGSVGRLLPGMEWYLEQVEGIETGGSLVVRGPNVMLGYLLPGKPDGIQPAAAARGAGWYDTGDVARVDEDDFLYIIGRVKRFAKVGSEMVPLGVIEELAARCWPGCGHAAVSLPHPSRGEQVVLLSEMRDPDAAELRRFITELGYSGLFVPSRLFGGQTLPVLGTGKPDYRALRVLAEQLA